MYSFTSNEGRYRQRVCVLAGVYFQEATEALVPGSLTSVSPRKAGGGGLAICSSAYRFLYKWQKEDILITCN